MHIRGEEEEKKADGNGWKWMGWILRLYIEDQTGTADQDLYYIDWPAAASAEPLLQSLYRSREMTALNWRTSAPWSRGRVESFETAKSTVQMAKLRSSYSICVCVCTRQCTAARLPPLVYQFEKKKKEEERRKSGGRK
jgi:hypothetical protein